MHDRFELVPTEGGTLAVRGELTHINATAAIATLRSAIKRHRSDVLKINLAELESVNSVVLSFLLTGLREANKNTCGIQYVQMSDSLFNMARVGGVEGLLTSSTR